MTRATVGAKVEGGAKDSGSLEPRDKQEHGLIDIGAKVQDRSGDRLDLELQQGEEELLRELIRDLRAIRYGSIFLVIHDGRLVEVNKTTKIRKGRTSNTDKERSE